MRYLALAALLALLAFFAAGEFALIHLRPSRVQLLAADGHRGARSVARLQHRLRRALAARLEGLLHACEDAEWVWFEDRLSYDNARLCEALIVTGQAIGACNLIEAGLRSLRWLLHGQRAPGGHFRPVGSQGFLLLSRQPPMAFDQQPVEACATIAACLAARAVDSAPMWQADARQAFAWFLGANDLSIPLADTVTGACRDGLHPDRANENRGAESVLAYLLGLCDMHRLAEPAASRAIDHRLGQPRLVPSRLSE